MFGQLVHLKVGEGAVAVEMPEFQKFDFARLVLMVPTTFFNLVFFVGKDFAC